MRRAGLIVKKTLAVLGGYLVLALLFVSFSGELGAQNWRTASRAPAGFAPDPTTTPEAVVQVFAARTISWQGAFVENPESGRDLERGGRAGDDLKTEGREGTPLEAGDKPGLDQRNLRINPRSGGEQAGRPDSGDRA